METMFIEIGEHMLKVMGGNDVHKYVGKSIPGSLKHRNDIELGRRFQRAWHKFHEHRHVLTDQNVSVRLRLKLFQSVITPTLLFGLPAAALTKHQTQSLDVLQNKMLRLVVGWRRCEGEDWADTMRRMRDRIANAMQIFPIEKWSELHYRRLFRFARRSACSDTEWTQKVIVWNPRYTHGATRARGRPPTRWDDRLQGFARDVLHNVSRWYDSVHDGDEDAFVEYCIHA